MTHSFPNRQVDMRKGNAWWAGEIKKGRGEHIQENATKDCGWGHQRQEEESVQALRIGE